ncbi:thioredoxin-like protein [Aspergillus pseudonomiae]|uniref:Glutathione S-transferase kappa n=1 Tax=Aspergillus pseudonomiae TaxID=1506151 RepID=A0A5N7DIV9_9EURO|nr:thioredoxin-like protein [Aspergillus pseudonomiae]KAE8406195.1 thioredoxin-like protein [Aspergillus pseudonomiae]
MSTPKVTLYFDLLSPFSYVAFHILKNSPIFSKCNITYTPILLRDLFAKCQNTPPIAVKNKSTWINKERLYWSRRLKLPMCETPPAGFPFPTAEVQSILLVLGERYPERLALVVERLYRGLWGEGDSRVVTTDGFMGVLEEVFGGEGAGEILEASKEPEIKLRLTENTQRAFDNGAFGLPWFECVNSRGEKECFWGVDHLARVVEFLDLERGDSSWGF